MKKIFYLVIAVRLTWKKLQEEFKRLGPFSKMDARLSQRAAFHTRARHHSCYNDFRRLIKSMCIQMLQ